MNANQHLPELAELSGLFARAYLRISEAMHEIGPEAPILHEDTPPQNRAFGLDVRGQQSDELAMSDRRRRRRA